MATSPQSQDKMPIFGANIEQSWCLVGFKPSQVVCSACNQHTFRDMAATPQQIPENVPRIGKSQIFVNFVSFLV